MINVLLARIHACAACRYDRGSGEQHKILVSVQINVTQLAECLLMSFNSGSILGLLLTFNSRHPISYIASETPDIVSLSGLVVADSCC